MHFPHLRPGALALLSQLPYADTQACRERLKRQFVARYGPGYPQAAAALERHWERVVKPFVAELRLTYL